MSVHGNRKQPRTQCLRAGERVRVSAGNRNVPIHCFFHVEQRTSGLHGSSSGRLPSGDGRQPISGLQYRF
jgi:hypothetical protein